MQNLYTSVVTSRPSIHLNSPRSPMNATDEVQVATWSELPDRQPVYAPVAGVSTVLLSVLLHGITASWGARTYGARAQEASDG